MFVHLSRRNPVNPVMRVNRSTRIDVHIETVARQLLNLAVLVVPAIELLTRRLLSEYLSDVKHDPPDTQAAWSELPSESSC